MYLMTGPHSIKRMAEARPFPRFTALVVGAFLANGIPVPAYSAPGKEAALMVATEGEGDFVGSTGEAIEAAAKEAHRRGGGTVRLLPGDYILHREIDLSGLRGVRLLGEEGVILKAVAQKKSTTQASADASDEFLPLEAPERFPVGGMIEIHSPGRSGTKPSGEPYQVPYIMARVAGHEEGGVRLASPLAYPVPKDATVISVFNGVVIRGDSADLQLIDLTIDLNREEWPIAPLNHTYHCGVFVSGPYGYESGPTGPPVEGLSLVGCTVRNAHHRGIGLYSAVHASIVNCRVENTDGEGIVFDHFCYHCEAVGNTLVNCRNIELNDASDCLVSHNRIESADVGIVIWQWCTQDGLNEQNLIVGNEIIGARAEGIILKPGADQNLVLGNMVQGSGKAGIVIRGDQNIISGNRISEAGEESIRDEGNDNRGPDL